MPLWLILFKSDISLPMLSFMREDPENQFLNLCYSKYLEFWLMEK